MFTRPSITKRLLLTVFALAAVVLILLAALYAVSLVNAALWQYSSVGRLVKSRWIETRSVVGHFMEQGGMIIRQSIDAPMIADTSALQGISRASLLGTRKLIVLDIHDISEPIEDTAECLRIQDTFRALDNVYWHSATLMIRTYLVVDGCRGVLISSSAEDADFGSGREGADRVGVLLSHVRKDVSRLVGANTKKEIWVGPYRDPFAERDSIGCVRIIRDRNEKPKGMLLVTIDTVSFGQRLDDDDPEVLFGMFAPNGKLAFSDQVFPIENASGLASLPSYSLRPDAGRVAFSNGHIWLAFQSPDTGWQLVYGVRYGKILSSHSAQLLGCLTLLAVCLFGLWFFVRFMRRQVIDPAIETGRQLVESEAFNRTMLETAPVGVCVLAVGTGRIAHQNERARRLLSGHPDCVEGQIFAQVAEQDHGSFQLKVPNETEKNVRHLQIEYARTRHRGEPVVLCALTDISAQKLVENALLSARFAADQANEAKSAFLAMMSHEIRTPLYGMLGTLELLALSDMTETQRAQLQMLDFSSRTLLNIINDLLDLSKIEAGRLVLESTKLDLPALVERCVQSVAPVVRRKGVDLYCHIEPAFPRVVVGDEVRLQQILANLLSNAIKFTDEGKIVVRLLLRRNIGHRVAFSLQIIDSGIGIALHDRERIFEPFAQADGSSARRFGGTGLGLSICRRLVDLMGGRIDLASEPGLGSCFTIICELPAPDVEASKPGMEDLGSVVVRSASGDQGDTLRSLANRAGARIAALDDCAIADDGAVLIVTSESLVPDDVDTTFSGLLLVLSDGPLKPVRDERFNFAWRVSSYSQDSIIDGLRLVCRLPSRTDTAVERTVPEVPRLRILVAEDHPINQQLLAAQLEKLGCLVTLANTGAEALQCWRNDCFDLVLTDINMPELDGYGLARALRRNGVKQPIIGLTAYTDASVRSRAEEAGLDTLAIKPISLDSLAEVLRAQAVEGEQKSDATPITPLSPDSVPESIRDVFRSAMTVDLTHLVEYLNAKEMEALRICAHRVRGALAVLHDVHGMLICEELEAGAMAARPSEELAPLVESLSQHLHPTLKTADHEYPDIDS